MFYIFQIRKRSSITSESLKTGGSINANVHCLQTIQRRFLVLLIVYVLIRVFTTMSYVFLFLNIDHLVNAFQQYMFCALTMPDADCIEIFREKALPQLMLVSDFAWQIEATVTPTVFLFAYKDVRDLWFSIITCSYYCNKKANVSRQNTEKLTLSFETASIPPTAMSTCTSPL